MKNNFVITILSITLFCSVFAFTAAIVSAQDEKEVSVDEKLKVPSGTPDELHSYMSELRSFSLRTAKSAEEYYGFLKKKSASTIEAANKILEHAESTAEHKTSAVKDQMSAYYTNLHLGEKANEAMDSMKKLVEKVEKEDIYADIRKEVNAMHLNARITQMRNGIGNAEKDIKAEFETLHKDVNDYLAKTEWKNEFSSMAHGMLEAGSKVYGKGTERLKGLESMVSDYKKAVPEGFHKTLEGVGRRASLEGMPMELETVSIDVKKLVDDYAKADDPEKFDTEAWLKENPVKDFKLDSLKGKVVLVDFWATWCGPCLAEVPNMLEQYNKYHDKGFEIVGYSCDQNITDLIKFVGKEKTPWIVCSSKLAKEAGVNDYYQHYGVQGIPTMILIDKEGKAIHINARGNELNEQLEKIFAAE